jgi:hypothetical protein
MDEPTETTKMDVADPDPVNEGVDRRSAADEARPWWKRRWVATTALGLVAFLVGVMVGGDPGLVADATDRAEQAEADVSDLRGQVEALGNELARLEDESAVLAAALEAAPSDDDLVERERALEDRASELEERERTLADAERGLASLEADIAEREEAVGIEEQRQADRSFGNGTWVVGTDIEPGTYRTDGATGPGCYWARLSGLSGEFGDIITNGITEGPTTVTIASSDAAFESQGCQQWTRTD